MCYAACWTCHLLGRIPNAFRSHHIPDGLIERKLNEFLALNQGTRTVLQYAQVFNHLCQYAGHHADTDAKKRDRFRRGLNTKLKERLNLIQPNTYNGWSIWPLLKRTILLHVMLRRSERHQQDPRVLSHRDIVWCRILHQDLHREMPQRAGLFLDRLSSKDDSDLQYLSSSSLAKGQMPHSSIVGMVIIGASTAAVLPTLPRIVRSPKRIIQGRIPTRITTTTRARARGKQCKFSRGELTSLLLLTFPKKHQSCRVHSLSTINPQLYYLILVQLIVL